jgi:hypothetical protein
VVTTSIYIIPREESRSSAAPLKALLAAHTISIEIQILTIPLFRRIFLARCLYPGQNPNAQEYNRSHDNPVRGHVHQVRAVNQSADHDYEADRVESERHGISSFKFAAMATARTQLRVLLALLESAASAQGHAPFLSQ